MKTAELSPLEDATKIPEQILGPTGYDEWEPSYWFTSFEELDRIFYRPGLFCGYSASHNRLFLMNWHD